MTDTPKMADPARVARALEEARVMRLAWENYLWVEYEEAVEDEEVLAWVEAGGLDQ
jgi:hypothetical protein